MGPPAPRPTADAAAALTASLDQLREVRRNAEDFWTPGQALGEILAYLARIEHFTGVELTASSVQRRMRWLTSVLHAAAQRAEAAGLEPGQLTGIFSALDRHDALLSSKRTVVGPPARAARDLIRVEIAYLAPGRQELARLVRDRREHRCLCDHQRQGVRLLGAARFPVRGGGLLGPIVAGKNSATGAIWAY
jgi:hypothetical protein